MEYAVFAFSGSIHPNNCSCCSSPLLFQAEMASGRTFSVSPPINIEATEGLRRGAASSGQIIDCHGHYTTEPQPLLDWRKRQIAAIGDRSQMPSIDELKISDDELRQSVEGAQLRLQRERGTSMTLFSPRASGMSHHIGDAAVSEAWSRVSNDLIYRLTKLYPKNFIGVCQLPQSPGVEPKNCIAELTRCVEELGFVGCNLNPDPSGGYWKDPPLTDRWWYPLYEKMVELDVPAMIHVSAAANPVFHTTGSHYINGDTTAFVQFLMSDLFKDFPTLKLIIPHGGGAIPYHWGRYRGIAQDQKRPPLSESVLKNVFFDTCVYHQPGIDLLTKVIPAENILFASEMLGAVKGIDPETGFNYDHTRRYIEDSTLLSADEKRAILAGNARRVYSRIPAEIFN
jgi:4-oxalmesaconate hydratase